MNRPTVSEFLRILRNAYEKIGFSPLDNGSFYNMKEKKCCPVGALNLAAGRDDTSMGPAENEWKSLEEVIGPHTSDQRWAFIRGWDSHDPFRKVPEELEYFNTLGLEAHKEIMG